MEIKQNGINPSIWKEEIKCPRCNALLEISVKDISTRTKSKRDFWGKKSYIASFTVNCTNCNTKIILNKEKLPSLITEYLLKARDPVETFLDIYFS